MTCTGPPRTSCTSTAEGDGQTFTERAASMLAAIFVAAKREAVPCLPYARELIRLGLRTAGERLDRMDPLLCQQLVADRLADADWESRFLTGSWQRWYRGPGRC